ncbi:MAG TPA: hypothetical protein VFX22_02765, partial [Candidatus Kapabacteria bacterium]|nr:hypothetical protein [Candidatus Kapabacteria bacterium]
MDRRLFLKGALATGALSLGSRGLLVPGRARAEGQAKLLIPMDLDQTDHLKAYGITFWALQHSLAVDWLLNYRGGSFMADYSDLLAAECRIRGVSFEQVDASSASSIYGIVQSPDKNMDVVRLEKAP